MMTRAADHQAALTEAGEAISDMLTMLGVDPDHRQVEDIHGIDTEMGDDVKTIIARSAVTAYLNVMGEV